MAMTTLAFDTHKAVKSLTEAGAGEPLAEAMVATIGVAMGENMASKADVKGLGKDLRQEMADLRKDINARMDGLEQRMDSLKNQVVIRLGGVVVACTIVLGILVKL